MRNPGSTRGLLALQDALFGVGSDGLCNFGPTVATQRYPTRGDQQSALDRVGFNHQHRLADFWQVGASGSRSDDRDVAAPRTEEPVEQLTHVGRAGLNGSSVELAARMTREPDRVIVTRPALTTGYGIDPLFSSFEAPGNAARLLIGVSVVRGEANLRVSACGRRRPVRPLLLAPSEGPPKRKRRTLLKSATRAGCWPAGSCCGATARPRRSDTRPRLDQANRRITWTDFGGSMNLSPIGEPMAMNQ
jgi:hypothetical protein